jgi:dsDNA-specific endonuclease/ATPase MutS2
MHKKIMTAVVALVGLGLVAGCERRTPREEVAEQRQELMETRQEAAQERQEIAQDMREGVVEERQEAQEELAEVREDVREDERELAEARQELMQERMVTGQVRTVSPDALVLIIPEEGNREMRFQPGEQRQALQNLQPGDEVRASYLVSEEGNLILSDIEVQQGQQRGLQQPGQHQFDQ